MHCGSLKTAPLGATKSNKAMTNSLYSLLSKTSKLPSDPKVIQTKLKKNNLFLSALSKFSSMYPSKYCPE